MRHKSNTTNQYYLSSCRMKKGGREGCPKKQNKIKIEEGDNPIKGLETYYYRVASVCVFLFAKKIKKFKMLQTQKPF